jgi:predicted nucleotidyltransferase component of viral defense system
MDIREICAEKIRAASDRALYRDFYDLALLFDNFKFDIEEIAGLIQKKEIRKSITQESIRHNWIRAKKEKEAELSRIYYSNEVSATSIELLVKKLKINIK